MLHSCRIFLLLSLGLSLLGWTVRVQAQVAPAQVQTLEWRLQHHATAADRRTQEIRLDQDPTPSSVRLRQSILLGSLTLSAIGYGVFALRFNQARSRAEDAEQAYLEDLRVNGQDYLDAGTPLDEIATFKTWEEHWESAVVAREWNSRMGVLTAIAALFTILDSATTGSHVERTNPKRTLAPVVRSGPLTNGPELHIGARLSF